jgi:hypothetical protein
LAIPEVIFFNFTHICSVMRLIDDFILGFPAKIWESLSAFGDENLMASSAAYEQTSYGISPISCVNNPWCILRCLKGKQGFLHFL